MKLSQMLDKMNAKETQNIKLRNYEPLWRYLDSNRHMPKNLWMILAQVEQVDEMVQVSQLEQLEQLK